MTAPPDGEAPEISVVVSTYNRADRLPGAIASLLTQVGAVRYEVIVVGERDDGSASERNTCIPSIRQPLPGLEAVSNEAAGVESDLANDFGRVV